MESVDFHGTGKIINLEKAGYGLDRLRIQEKLPAQGP
jgi:hypothetical protein